VLAHISSQILYHSLQCSTHLVRRIHPPLPAPPHDISPDNLIDTREDPLPEPLFHLSIFKLTIWLLARHGLVQRRPKCEQVCLYYRLGILIAGQKEPHTFPSRTLFAIDARSGKVDQVDFRFIFVQEYVLGLQICMHDSLCV
jgi:hypothetical protein